MTMKKTIVMLSFLLLFLLSSCRAIPVQGADDPAANTSSSENSTVYQENTPSAEDPGSEEYYYFVPNGSPVDASMVENDNVMLTIHGSLCTIINAEGQTLVVHGYELYGSMEVYGFYQEFGQAYAYPLKLLVPYSESFTVTLGAETYGVEVTAEDYYGYIHGPGLETLVISSTGVSGTTNADTSVRTIFSSSGGTTPEFWIDGNTNGWAELSCADGMFLVSGYTGEAAVGTGRFSLDSTTTVTIQESTVFSVQDDVPAVVSPT